MLGNFSFLLDPGHQEPRVTSIVLACCPNCIFRERKNFLDWDQAAGNGPSFQFVVELDRGGVHANEDVNRVN